MKPEHITEVDWKLLQQKYPENIKEIIEKLNHNYPVQYLIGNVDFYDCQIKVNESVLIPRFETELLCEKIIKKLQTIKYPLNVIDLGCGSGCISIALKKNLNINMTALDISEKALNVAIENAKINQVDINFLHQSIEEVNLTNYNVIISNPPYVSYNESVDLATKYEPQNAIFSSENGLYFYQQILKKIKFLPNHPKLIAFEIGMNQGNDIKKIFEENLSNYKFSIEKDYSGKDRFILIEKEEE